MKGVAIAVVLMSATAVFCQQSSKAEQSKFGAEEKIQRPVKIPAQILTVLKKDDDVQRCLSDLASPQPQPAWFSAGEVTLTDEPRSGILVKPENACLFGANIVPFWVFERGDKGYRLILNVHVLGLKLLTTKTNNHRDIRTDKASAVTVYSAVYKFKKGRYELARSWSQAIR